MKHLFLSAIIAFAFCRADAQASKEWFTVKSDSGKFWVSFPSQPEESVETVETDIGTIDMHMAILDLSADSTAPTMLYLSSWNDYPIEKVNITSDSELVSFYNGTLNGSVENVKGKLIQKKEIKMGGKTAMSADIDFQEGAAVIHIQYLLVKNRLYMLETITETAKKDNIAASRFFDSFKLK